jgi:hypothetical protein
MKTQLVGLNPDGIVGMAPYYLKSYYMGKVDPVNGRDVLITGYDVNHECKLATNDICNQAPDVLAFSCYVWNMEQVLDICAKVRRHLPKTTILLGGPEASPRAMELLPKHSSVDIIAVGEGEITFAEVVDHYCTGRIELADIRGIVYREKGEIRANAPREVIKDLDEIPSPFLNGVVEFDKLKGYLFGYETFRGCPFSCSFCYWGRMMSVRYFSTERVKQEMAVILNSSMKRMWLGDAVANLNKKRFKDFLRTVIEANNGLIIDFEMVAELLDEETIDLMGQLHDGYVAFGLQSINHLALATVERKWNREKFTKNVRLLRQRTDKIKIYIDLIYGLPHDSPQTYEDGIRYAMSLLPQKIQLHPLLLLPGSPLFDHPQDFGLVYEEKAPHYVVESKFWSRADMEEAAKWTNKIFVYFNPAVNMTVIMLSQILNEDAFDLFNRLYAFITAKLDPTLIFSDIGIVRENALMLNDLLEEFIRAELGDEESYGAYLVPLIDAMAFVGCKTMFYASGGADDGTLLAGWNTSRSGVYPILSRNVVLKRFSHDMSALYKGNLLRSPEELLRFEPTVYDVLFNLRTHSIYHVSEHVSDLLAASSGDHTLEELVERLAQTRNLAIDNGTYSAIQETFNDLARKQVVDLIGYQVAV